MGIPLGSQGRLLSDPWTFEKCSVIWELYRGNIGIVHYSFGICWGYIRIMEENIETIIMPKTRSYSQTNDHEAPTKCIKG